jgi:hypothetical protein
MVRNSMHDGAITFLPAVESQELSLGEVEAKVER